MKGAVTVLASLNIDLVASVESLPSSGETVQATQLTKFFGGKGANQAVAAARQGAAVSIIGCVSNDAEGRNYQKRLQVEGIDVSAIRRHHEALTGTAMIGVDAKGENLIMVAQGANGKLTAGWVRENQRRIETANYLLLQFEVPREAILEAIQLATAAEVPVIVNPSPFDRHFPWLTVKADTIIVNETEAERLFSLSPNSLNAQCSPWLKAMRAHAIDQLIITRGVRPTLVLVRKTEQFLEVPMIKVSPIDTVGAGDTFAGTLASALSNGLPLEQALTQANTAGALATLAPGGQEAMPSAQDMPRP